MGYTHYWKFGKPGKANGKADILELRYQQAIAECNVVIHGWQALCEKGGPRDAERLSGFSAHSTGYGGLKINGKGDNAHEDFALPEHFRDNVEGSFCKTARKPYDIVVVACLCILKDKLGSAFSVSSDGRYNDWQAGRNLAQAALGRQIVCPIAPQFSEEDRDVYGTPAKKNATALFLKKGNK